MKVPSFVVVLGLAAIAVAKDCPLGNKSNSKLFCYYSKLTQVDSCYCSHIILPSDADVKSIDYVRENFRGVKVLVTVHEFNQGLVDLLKKVKVDGLELNLNKLDSKNDISDFISTVRSKLGSDLYLALSVPSKAEILAKYYDFKTLSKHADLFILQTAFLGASKNVTFHPSRLSGMWDMQNTDSVVDLVSGLGAPLSKLVISAPVQAFQFKLQNEDYTAPGSPAVEVKSITRDELCKLMTNGDNWTLERDQDQAGPYIFNKNQWIAFEDSMSMDIKAKYSRVRGLAGMALKDVSQDGGDSCADSVLEAAFNGLSRQSRAPRGAVLHSLEREILQTPSKPLDSIQVSPYRISRVIDVEGKVHVVRQDTRTEFECSRQGYFVHPRSCNRFYRCVKFDQLSDEFSVFEFDCPAGLAFDERVEVCVWPGSLPHGTACSGSSEIAPVPKERFVCPSEPGYYADPENCRWFFACLDHGKSPLTAYEFRCPFGLVFDSDRLMCEWPWLVAKCGHGAGLGINLATEYHYGGAFGGQGYASGVALDKYDGLGSLGVVRLGGVSGKIEQPIAKVYSNVGVSGLGYENGDLSLKTAQSLENAGLIKTGLGIGTGQTYSYGNGGADHVGANGVYSSNIQFGGNADSSGYSSHDNSNLAAGYGAKVAQVSSAGTANYVLNKYAGNFNLGVDNSASLSGNSAYHNQAAGHDAKLGHISSVGNANYASNVYSGSANLGLDSSKHSFAGLSGHSAYDNLNLAFGQGSAGKTVNYASNGYSGNANFGVDSSSDISGHSAQDNSNLAVNQISLVGNAKYASNDYSETANLGVDSLKHSSADFLGHSAYDNSNLAIGQVSSVGNVNYASHDYSGNGGSKIDFLAHSPADFSGQSAYDNSHVTAAYDAKLAQVSSAVASNLDEQYALNGYSGNSNLGVGSSVHSSSGFSGYSANDNSNLAAGYGGKVAQISSVGTANADGKYALNSHFTNSEVDSSSLHTKYASGEAVSNLGLGINSNDFGAKSTQSFVQNHNKDQVVGSGLSTTQYQNNIALGQQNVFLQGGLEAGQSSLDTLSQHSTGSDDFGAKTYQGLNQYSGSTLNNAGSSQGDLSSVQYQEHIGSKLIANDAESGAKSSQSFTQYHQGDNINIVGGGYSAVGADNSGILVSNNGEGISVSTPAPFSVTTHAYVPSVTAVPIPTLQTASGFESYKGGVIANIPQLQYKLQGHSGLVNVTRNYVNVVSSTPSTLGQDFVYNTPSVAVVEGQKQNSLYNTDKSSSYSYHSQVNTENGGYVYQKPSVAFVEGQLNNFNQGSKYYESNKPLAAVQQVVVQPQVSVTQNQGYVYEKPSVTFEERPKLLSTISFSTTTAKPVEHVVPVQPLVSSYYQTKDTAGYTYKKPSIEFEENPHVSVTSYSEVSTPKPLLVEQKPQVYISSTVTPTLKQEVHAAVYKKPQIYVSSTIAPITEHKVQPAVSSYNFNQQINTGYVYPKPVVAFEQRPVEKVEPVIISKLSIRKPNVQTSYVQPTSQPAVSVQPIQPSLATYSYQQDYGYKYPQPSVAFNEKPVSVTYQQPIENTYASQYPVQQKPVTSYTYQDVLHNSVSKGYSYPKPQVSFEEKPLLQPVVSTYLPATEKPVTYTYKAPSTIKTVTYAVPTPAPAVVTNYNYISPSTNKPNILVQKQEVKFNGYEYPKPSVQFGEEPTPLITTYENRQPVQEIPFVKKTAYTTGQANLYQYNQKVDAGYNYKNSLNKYQSNSNPVIIENYQAPAVNVNYEKVQKKLYSQSVDNSHAYYINNAKQVSSQPDYQEEYYVQSTPKPDYISTVATVLASKKPVSTEYSNYHFYDSRLSSTPTTIVKGYTYSKPKIVFEEKPVVSTTYLPVEPNKEYLPVDGTITTSRPIVRYSFSSLDKQYETVSTRRPVVYQSTTPLVKEYLPVTQNVQVSTEQAYVVPEITTFQPKIRYTVNQPVKQYLPVRKVKVTTPAPIDVNTPSRDYLPVRSRVKVTTQAPLEVSTISREYLPVKSGAIVDGGFGRKAKIVKIIRPKTIVKQNDFHPLLSAKLGAQCTCVSNTLNLRKKQKVIVVEDDDDDDDYAVANEEGTVVENYRFEPEKTVEITPTPQDYIKSTTNEVIPAPTPNYAIRRRVKVYPSSTTVSYDSENNFEEEVIINEEKSSSVSDREIAKAVRTGLKLVKEAAKEGAKEGTVEGLNEYGPGATGNSRNSIECQRAGLFRHPNKCNKFYACRWDCTKNKFTLHTFNCPVHLTFDNSLGACNWPSKGPACLENTLLPSD